MSNGIDIDRLVKDPSLLIDLCREVIDLIDNSPEDPRAGEKEAQLREIAKAIEKLKKIGVAVPDPLRAEKTRLAADLNIKTETNQTLRLLIEGFEKIIQELKARFGQITKPKANQQQVVNHSLDGKRRTSRNDLIQHLLDSLKELGGSAHCNDVLDLMERSLQGKFLPGDLDKDDSFGVKWKHNAHWARLKLANDGILIKNSPRGYWQLNKRSK
jgi:hypothetical protein